MLNKLSSACLLLLSATVCVHADYCSPNYQQNNDLNRALSKLLKKRAIEVALIMIDPSVTQESERSIARSTSMDSDNNNDNSSENMHNSPQFTDLADSIKEAVKENKIINIGCGYGGMQGIIQALQKSMKIEIMSLPQTIFGKNGTSHVEVGHDGKYGHTSFGLEVTPRRASEGVIKLDLAIAIDNRWTEADGSMSTTQAQHTMTSFFMGDNDVIAFAGFMKEHAADLIDKPHIGNMVILMSTKAMEPGTQVDLAY